MVCYKIKDNNLEYQDQNENMLGLVQVYTGDGKGKTTAALGLALRACGHRFSVVIIQFAKGVSYVGELFSIQRLYPEIQLYRFGRDCPYSSGIKQGFKNCQKCGMCMIDSKEITKEDREMAEKGLSLAMKMSIDDGIDILILDEISLVINLGLINMRDVVNLIDKKSNHIELILTGRDMPEDILEHANLVTEMRNIKHPFSQNMPARRGIEF